MEMKKIREKKIKELLKMRNELKLRYADEYFDMRMGKIKDSRKPIKTRREIAQIEIALTEKNKDKLTKDQKDGKAKA